MYGWVWRHIPGPMAVRLVTAAILVLAIVAVLFLWVFPLAAPLVPFNDNTVGD